MASYYHAYIYVRDIIQEIIVVFFRRIRILFKEYPYLCGQKSPNIKFDNL